MTSAQLSHNLAWFRSSYSTEQGGNCVEVAALPTTIHVRDSKVPDGPRLALSPEAWSAFTAFARTAD
ncbi:DUF397 domain-containing protein [Streptomyces syringium]|uniref:DUF397 domain-containing protein n=1 Tax=Streptomyces syringium TaxID=76729 RepID=A0ABS4Y2Z5_9ACTN|nr:DUF397 domain-containing protein [Streptomyces syringium]MBP2403149.1 hypothetical protein [Streptomyces syringium]